MSKIFSASSLKLLQKDPEKYKTKYEMGLSFNYSTEYEKKGNAFHKLIYYYLKGFDVQKILKGQSAEIQNIWQNLLKSNILNQKFEMLEKPFLISFDKFYLTGRFDAISKQDDYYIIYDWKTENLPKDIVFDIQTVVYMLSAFYLFETDKIKVKYVSLKNLEEKETIFLSEDEYKKIILNILNSNNILQ